MTTMNLGAITARPKDYGPLADMVSGLRDSITADVCEQIVAQVTSAVVAAVADAVTGQIVMAAPQITMPTIHVEVPGEDEQGEIDAIDRNTAAVQSLTAEVALLRILLMQPVTKDVSRDTNNNITRVTETR